eukprot:symbB.v1.2.000286.t1/scaffold24.1/size427761/2
MVKKNSHDGHSEDESEVPAPPAPPPASEVASQELNDINDTETVTATVTTAATTATTATSSSTGTTSISTTSATTSTTSSSSTTSSTVKAGDLDLVIISDLHHFPRYKQTFSAACHCRANKKMSTQVCKAKFPALWGRKGCNTPRRLLDLSLRAAAKQEPQLWLILGDLVDHNAGASISSQVSSTTEAVKEKKRGFNIFNLTLSKIGAASRGKCVLAFGNNDKFPRYAVDFKQEDFYLPEAKVLQRHCLLPNQAFETLKRFGYYSLQLSEKMTLLVLNTVIYASKKKELHTSKVADPFGQFAWLEKQLASAMDLHTQVYIAGHIPPVVSSYSLSDLWESQFAVMYWNLLHMYQDVVAGQFFGHEHRDEFRVHDFKDSSPPLLLFPSVSPVFSNNPSFCKLEIRNGCLHQMQTFWANLEEETPEFTLEYAATPTLVKDITNAQYRELAYSFSLESPEGQENWRRYFAQLAVQTLGNTVCSNATQVDSVSCSECVAECKQQAVCTVLYGLSVQSMNVCMEEGLWEKKSSEPLEPTSYAEVQFFILALLAFIGLCYIQYKRYKVARARRPSMEISEVELCQSQDAG